MEMFVLSASALGIATSVVVQLIKLIPWFGKTKQRKRVLALLVSLLATIIFAWNTDIFTGGDWFWWVGSLGVIMAVAYATHKTILKAVFRDENEDK
jgi:apolipoprotein N-acyltransferase